MIFFVPGLFVIFALITASISDMKTREVPDIISYLLILTGITYGAISSVVIWQITPLLTSFLGFLSMAVLSMLLYFTGQWGGGDAKLLMGIGAWLGLTFEINSLFMYLLNSIIVGGMYGTLWGLYLGIKNHKAFKQEFKKVYLKLRKVGLIIMAIMLFVGFFGLVLINNQPVKILLAVIPVFTFLFFYLIIAAKAVETVSFFKKVPVSKLTEGDWIVNEIKSCGKVIVKQNDIGITKKQLELLRKSDVKTVLIKEGIPFVPALTISFIITWIFGNWFVYVF